MAEIITINTMLEHFVFSPNKQLVYDARHPEREPITYNDFAALYKASVMANPAAREDNRRRATLPVAEVWLGHVQRKDVFGETFQPGKDVITDDNLFNRWKCPWEGSIGSRNKKKWAKDWEALLTHMLPSKESREYADQFVAQTFQDPANVPSVALVLMTACKGTGRGTWLHCLKKAMGKYLSSVQSVEMLAGYNHNNWMYSKLIIAVNEIAAPHDHRDNAKVSNLLKTWVADHNALVNPKGRDMFDADLYFRMIIATNSNHGVTIEEGDRRFAVFQGNSKPLPVEIAERIRSASEHPEFAAFVADYYLNIKLKKNFLFKPPPMTSAKRSMMHLSKDEQVALFMDVIREIETDLASASCIRGLCELHTDMSTHKGFTAKVKKALDAIGATDDQARIAGCERPVRFWILKHPEKYQSTTMTPEIRRKNITFSKEELTSTVDKPSKITPISGRRDSRKSRKQ